MALSVAKLTCIVRDVINGQFCVHFKTLAYLSALVDHINDLGFGLWALTWIYITKSKQRVITSLRATLKLLLFILVVDVIFIIAVIININLQTVSYFISHGVNFR